MATKRKAPKSKEPATLPVKAHRHANVSGCLVFAGKHLAYNTVPDTVARQWMGRPDPYPYGGKLWGSSVVLAEYILNGPSLDGLSVLDLGCGLGLAGIAAGLQGAAVTFADFYLQQAQVAVSNALLSGVHAQAVAVDWRVPDSYQGRHNLILGGDLMYAEAGVKAFVMRALLPGGSAILAAPTYRAREMTGKPELVAETEHGQDGGAIGLWVIEREA